MKDIKDAPASGQLVDNQDQTTGAGHPDIQRQDLKTPAASAAGTSSSDMPLSVHNRLARPLSNSSDGLTCLRCGPHDMENPGIQLRSLGFWEQPLVVHLLFSFRGLSSRPAHLQEERPGWTLWSFPGPSLLVIQPFQTALWERRTWGTPWAGTGLPWSHRKRYISIPALCCTSASLQEIEIMH